jgi:hypothetical protein
MEYAILGLVVFGLWWALMGAIYWLIIKKVLPYTTLEQRLEFFKTRRQRHLK